MAALKPVGVNTTLSTSGTASTSIAIAQQSDAIRVACEGAGVHVKVGGDPVATSLDYYVTTGEPETISIGPVQSQRVVGITTGATTTIDFPEGTGCPFATGEYVSLTVMVKAHLTSHIKRSHQLTTPPMLVDITTQDASSIMTHLL